MGINDVAYAVKVKKDGDRTGRRENSYLFNQVKSLRMIDLKSLAALKAHHEGPERSPIQQKIHDSFKVIRAHEISSVGCAQAGWDIDDLLDIITFNANVNAFPCGARCNAAPNRDRFRSINLHTAAIV